jgi:hypothetical protein
MRRRLLVLTTILSLTAPTAWGADPPDPSPGWRLSSVTVEARVDWQLVQMHDAMGSTLTGELMAAELELAATVASPSRDVLELAIGFPHLTGMEGIDGRGEEMHFGNAYGILRTGLGLPSLRFGQFVVPFGNLVSYETHTRPLQSLYPQSLGVRIDRGVSLEGLAGPYDFWLAAVGGNGPRSDNDSSPALTARLSRRHDLSFGTLTWGLSGLHGRGMPRFGVLDDPMMEAAHAAPPPSHPEPDMAGGETTEGGMEEHPPSSGPLDFTDKTRGALDAEVSLGRSLWRLEVVAGRDGDGPVNGQFLAWDFALTDRVELSLQGVRWEQPRGRQVRAGAAAAWRISDMLLARLSAERRFGYTPSEENAVTTASLQIELSLRPLWRR